MSVNASQAGPLAERLGTPLLTVMSGPMLGERPENIAAQSALRGRATGTLLLIEREIGAEQAAARLAALDYRYGAMVTISHWQRAGLTWRVLGEHLALGSGERKISLGVFTMLLVAWMRATPVAVSGFSLSTPGHAYDDHGHRRQHQEIDRRALRTLAARGRGVYAVDPGFSAESGLPPWSDALVDGAKR